MRFVFRTVASAVALAIAATAATASPLKLTYDVTESSPGLFSYDFTLTLDNADGTWTAGQQYDWIVFGDKSAADQPPGFGTLPSNFINAASPDPLASFTTSSGGHSGPTIAYGGSIVLPGWQPGAIGDALRWSGDSPIFLDQGRMFWSSIQTNRAAGAIRYQMATLGTFTAYNGAVPEPASWAMLITGFGLVGAASRRRKAVVAA